MSLLRDIARCCLPGEEAGVSILLCEETMPAEAYRIHAEDGCLVVCASDALGFVYGLKCTPEQHRSGAHCFGCQMLYFTFLLQVTPDILQDSCQ